MSNTPAQMHFNLNYTTGPLCFSAKPSQEQSQGWARQAKMFTFNFYDDEVQDKTVANKVEEGQVKVMQLEEVLGQLPDTLAFSLLAGIPRRELWHVKMQLMQNDQNAQLLGQSDVITGLYEGGLKTWECSVDLAQYLSQRQYSDDLAVLEVRGGLV
jgi:hypothetical protein